METVLEALNALMPKANLSPYAKRWWTKDLSNLRRIHTYYRNRARTARRQRVTARELDQRAREAAKEFHNAIRRQKKAHWEDFLEDNLNIWKAAKYLNLDSYSRFDKVLLITRTDSTTTKGKEEQAKELLKTFFLAPPENIDDEPTGE